MTESVERLRALMAQESPRVPLDEAALLVAAEEYPDLDIASYLHQLDAIAAGLQPKIAHELEPHRLIRILTTHLFGVWGFCGNVVEYHDPRNSFLNEVIDRRLGIPITLAIVCISVGRRLGLPVAGVSFPGHFVVTYQASPTPLYLDPFNSGRLVQEADFRRFLLEHVGPRARLDPTHLEPATAQEVIARLLRNLKAIYLMLDDLPRALRCSERIIIATDVPEERRDLGLLLARTGRPRDAIAELERYLKRAPAARDRDTVEQILDRLQRTVKKMN